MGKTFRNSNKGEKVRDKSIKKTVGRKFFGFTSGNHTDDHIIPNGDVWYVEDKGGGHFEHATEQRPAKKGKDYMKYGYPNVNNYPKRMVKAMKKGYKDIED